MSKLTPTKVSNIFAFVGVLVSVLAIIFSRSAINQSKIANNIASEAKEINKEELRLQKDTHSYQIVSTAFADIYDQAANEKTMESLKSGKKLYDKGKLLRVVDIIEGLGNDYCQGTAWKWHINTRLKNTLSYICNNEEVYTLFSAKKNGSAILCYEFFPDSQFAKSINRNNISSCQFYDSSAFSK